MKSTVLLALSTFRHSEHAVNRAIAATRRGESLTIVYVVDINLARYFIGTDAIMGTHLRETCEADLLRQHAEQARAKAESIAALAAEAGIKCETTVVTGRFAVETLKVVRVKTPRLVVTTRSRRPDWVRKFFGSPVDTVIRAVGCRVELV